MKKYLLGADGGNTKTDICIFDRSGNFVFHKRFGTCSHESVPNGFTGAEEKLDEFISESLKGANTEINDIGSAVFGLAGADFDWQKAKLTKIVQSLGFENFVVYNDGYLGIKAGSPDGTGVCSINGTGSICVGIDPSGSSAQIGGMGTVSGDKGGGAYLMGRAVARVYDELFRCREKTAMTPLMLELLGCGKKDYMENVMGRVFSGETDPVEILNILFDCADEGDKAAYEILDESALELARNTAGCVRELDFENTINIILAGSVWCKASTPIIIEQYRKHLGFLLSQDFNIKKLEARPVAGAVIWAYELLSGYVPAEVFSRIVSSVEEKLD